MSTRTQSHRRAQASSVADGLPADPGRGSTELRRKLRGKYPCPFKFKLPPKFTDDGD